MVSDAASVKLRIANGLRQTAYARRRDMTRLKEHLPFVGGPRFQNIREDCGLAITITLALLVVPLGHVGPLQRLPQPALLPQIAGAEHYQPLLRGITAVGRVKMPVARRLGRGAVAQIPGQVRAHQDHCDIEHRQIDALATTGALALE